MRAHVSVTFALKVSYANVEARGVVKTLRRVRRRTLSARIRLHELGSRARFLKLGRQPGKLGQDLVDDAHFGSEVVLVNVKGEETANVAETTDDEDRRFFGHLVCRVYVGCLVRSVCLLLGLRMRVCVVVVGGRCFASSRLVPVGS